MQIPHSGLLFQLFLCTNGWHQIAFWTVFKCNFVLYINFSCYYFLKLCFYLWDLDTGRLQTCSSRAFGNPSWVGIPTEHTWISRKIWYVCKSVYVLPNRCSIYIYIYSDFVFIFFLHLWFVFIFFPYLWFVLYCSYTKVRLLVSLLET